MTRNVKVYPNASKERVEEDGGMLKVYVCVSPEKGKANKRVCALLAEHFGVRKSAVTIIRGETCRDKLVDIEEI